MPRHRSTVRNESRRKFTRFSSRGGGRWFPRLTLLVLSTVLTLGAAELGLRLVGFSYPLFPEKIEFGFPSPHYIDSWYRPDPWLFWVRKDYEDRLEQSRGADVVFMGCSCTEFGKYDQYLAELVSTATGGETFSYLNAGMGGWTTFQGLRQLQRDIVPLRPKVITIYYGWNDHWIGFGIEDKRVAMVNDSLLFSLRGLRLIQLLDKAFVASSGRGNNTRPERVSLKDFKDNLGSMVRMARENDITPILLTAPTSHARGREPGYLMNRSTNSLEDLVQLHERYVEAVREVSREEGAILCDLAASFSEFPRTRLVRDYFRYDGIHLRNQGDREIARRLLECFQEHELLQNLTLPGGTTMALTGRELPKPRLKMNKGEAPPHLPARCGIKHIKRNPVGNLDILGWVLSPKIIDDVVVYIDGKNIGTARYPQAEANIERKYPEYEDPWSGFHMNRPFDLEPRAQHVCRIEVYSDNQIILSKEQTFSLEE